MCRIPGYLYYLPALQHASKTFPLPLKAVSVDAKVADFCASVTIRQTFTNAEDTPIEAIYQFPLEDKATVSDFTAIIDGKKIKGTIQEKEEAKNTYDDAIATGHGAYLMEEDKDTPNVFTVNVGNLPPGKEVEIAITYVTELEFEEGQLRFRLPSHNDNPTYTTSSAAAPHLKLRIDFNMTSNIRSLASPSHPIAFEFGEEPTQATVTLSDSPQAQAAKDLVVLTKLAKPHEPCGRVEVDEKGAKTVMVSIYPKLDAADDEDIYTEMIFIVDRSGSMSGSRINQVKDTLQIFLRSLGEGTMFNIIGFGSNTQHLFPQGSVEYNDRNLKLATEHVAKMSADLGGTNIMRPLQEVLKSPTKEGYPRQLFILTDGEVSNTQACIDFVRQHAQTTRVFTFGVGNDASQDLVKGLAKAGEGFYEFVRPGEAMEDKVMRQLHRAMQPALTDITVEWKGAARVQPAPFRLAPLFCGGRLVLYGLLDKAASAAAGELEVVVRAKTVLRPFEAVVKVDTAKTEPGSLFRKLAARTLLKDLEEGRSYMHDDKGAVKPGAGDVQAEAVRISLESGVLSKYTAFVAVEERDEATEGTMQVRKITFEKASARPVGRPVSTPSWGAPPRRPMTLNCHAPPPPSSSFSLYASPAMRAPLAKGSALPPPPPPAAAGPSPPCPISPRGCASVPPPPAHPMMASQQQMAPPMPRAGPPPMMTTCAPVSRSSMSAPSMSAPPPAPDRGGPNSAAPSFAKSRKSEASVEREKQTTTTSSAPPNKMREIIMKQNASGSWEWSHAADLVGLSADKLRAGIPAAKLQGGGVDNEVEALWATAVVAAYLSKHFPDQKVNWDLVVKKAIKFIARQKKNVQLKDPAEELDWFQLALAFLA